MALGPGFREGRFGRRAHGHALGAGLRALGPAAEAAGPGGDEGVGQSEARGAQRVVGWLVGLGGHLGVDCPNLSPWPCHALKPCRWAYFMKMALRPGAVKPCGWAYEDGSEAGCGCSPCTRAGALLRWPRMR